MSDDSGFLSRWSERKRRVQEETEALEEKALSEASEIEAPEDEFAGKSDDEILTELSLPAPESLKLGDSVAGFMDARVPERIRSRALRAFWKTNPVLANIDGLDEYCEDYTDAAMIIANMETIYEVGKGYASQALDALESLAETEESAEASGSNVIPPHVADERLVATVDEDPSTVETNIEAGADEQPEAIAMPEEAERSERPRAKRMQFRT